MTCELCTSCVCKAVKSKVKYMFSSHPARRAPLGYPGFVVCLISARLSALGHGPALVPPVHNCSHVVWPQRAQDPGLISLMKEQAS